MIPSASLPPESSVNMTLRLTGQGISPCYCYQIFGFRPAPAGAASLLELSGGLLGLVRRRHLHLDA